MAPADDLPTDRLREITEQVLAQTNAALSRLERKRTGRACPKRTRLALEALKSSGEAPIPKEKV